MFMTQLNYYTFSQFQKEQEDKYYAALHSAIKSYDDFLNALTHGNIDLVYNDELEICNSYYSNFTEYGNYLLTVYNLLVKKSEDNIFDDVGVMTYSEFKESLEKDTKKTVEEIKEIKKTVEEIKISVEEIKTKSDEDKKMIEKIKISVDKLCSFYSSSLLYI